MLLYVKILLTTVAVGHLGRCSVEVPQEIRDYFERKGSEPKWFQCPTGCDCKEGWDQKKRPEIVVSCYAGNFSDEAFSEIIQDCPLNTTSLTVEAPVTEPNSFLWHDNLNRLKKLRALRLINCGIPALSYSINLRQLELLDLRQNNIEHIKIDMFTEMPKLKALDLSHNKISVLPTGVFSTLDQLESLSLAYNNITELPAKIFDQRRMKTLHLDGNRISARILNNFLRDTQRLQRLELNYCELQNVWDLHLESLGELRRIGLAGNKLGAMPIALFHHLKHLEAIDLSDNDIHEVPKAPSTVNNITQLFLANNRLGNWKQLQNIESYGPIRQLDISYNNFEDFTTDLLGSVQKTVIDLNLSGNKLRYIGKRLVQNLTDLRILHLADNEISEIPSHLPTEYSQLVFLNLSRNHIQNLPYSSESLFSSLKRLDISQNRLYTLQGALIENFLNRLDQVYLYDNPWDCGCNIDLLKNHMNDRYTEKHELKYDKTRCMTPETLKGTVILELNQITDCAVLFGARYGFTQATELGVLLALLLAVSLFAALIILLAYYRRERRQKISYIDAHRSHSRTALTLSQHISRSPSSVIEPLTTNIDEPLSARISTKIPPPPPPPTITTY